MGDEKYFEDYVEGLTETYGPLTVLEEEMVEFAHRYDRQAMHIDPVYAQQGQFGALIASGWFTTVMLNRLLTDNFLSDASNLSSPGVDEVRWERPVYAGDELSLEVCVLEARRSRSKPDRGIVRAGCTLQNQNQETVLTMVITTFIRVRPD